MGAENPRAFMPFWPAAMGREMALAYTQVAEGQLKEWERSGKVRFSPRGRNGQRIALREDLDMALRSLVESVTGNDGAIEFD